jgi:hypothetical protein
LRTSQNIIKKTRTLASLSRFFSLEGIERVELVLVIDQVRAALKKHIQKVAGALIKALPLGGGLSGRVGHEIRCQRVVEKEA